MTKKYVYFFGAGVAEGKADMKDLLGGKGANLAEMNLLGIPVPPGFTITTEVCTYYYQNKQSYPPELEAQIKENLKKVEELMGRRFGDANKPLLVSVRSGARASMPGMMDTILNLGLTDESVKGIIKDSGDERFVYDSYRRFIQMYSDVVLGIPRIKFEHLLEARKQEKKVQLDTELGAQDWKELVTQFKQLVQQELGKAFPNDPWEQLHGAIGAVFKSWMNKRAIEYRRINAIPEEWGTAVSVQSMVFGNMGNDCATGVAFTRDPSTGEKVFFGEFLVNAQGEDVVAGIRTPQAINLEGKKKNGSHLPSMEEVLPDCYKTLVDIYLKLEKHYRDMQDIEFTIERGKVWMLQTRNAKRTAKAAVKVAVDMVSEKMISESEAILRIDPAQLDQLLHPTLDPKAKKEILGKGLPASPGAATGRVVFSAEDAEKLAKKNEKVILVRVETSPEDIHGMNISEGILTARGGMTCIAAETKILTDLGFMSAERAFGFLEDGRSLRILSLDSRTYKPVWRSIIAAGRRPAEITSVAISQTGRAENILRLTADHKMFVLNNRKLIKKELHQVLSDEDFVTVVGQVPSLGETMISPTLAYLAGAILSDGYICLLPTKGSVTFIQKPTPEKAEFIAAVEKAFEETFGVPFSYLRERENVSVLRGREIRGKVEDRICFKRKPAACLAEIRDHLSTWVLTLDTNALLHFLAGFVDGDGTYAEESSAVRLQISVSHAKSSCLEGLALACLRLGIVPQITNNRENYTLQISEKVEDILTFTHRVKADIPPRYYESRCLSIRGLFEDVVDQVNFMGRVREALKRNLMFGTEKIRRDILPLCPGRSWQETKDLLDSPLRSYRISPIHAPEPGIVYNFEVDATEEIDKNFIVFSDKLTPVLISNSHAAVVARGMGKCCVTGCGALQIDYNKTQFQIAGKIVKEGDWITLDGSTGEVILGKVPTLTPTLSGDFATLMGWVDKARILRVRTNADTPHDAKVARQFGAEGIGLCRTEHMFFDSERIEAVREMILSEDREGREKALKKILPMQKSDFKGIFREMKDFPVTIRLLDPPLHEFLPHSEEEILGLSKIMGVAVEKLKNKLDSLKEFNPMLGHRGCRLGITYPEIYEMQVRAIMEAACELAKEDSFKIIPEIMIPLVSDARELAILRAETEKVCESVMKEKGVQLQYLIGTMIELPRAALTADRVAEFADFFSFGTNDLTQTTYGLSRDDAGKFLPVYVERKIYADDPFVVLDQEGVGRLIKMATELGRKTKPKLKTGICGEHGGNPPSVEFCHRNGLEYVSCSPFRVPIARLSAAQAALKDQGVKGSSTV